MRLLIAFALAIAISACANDPAGSAPRTNTASVRVELGETFRLAPGEYVALVDGDLLVGFREVEGDSRCPVDVVCVWQGDAQAVVGTTSDRGRWNWATLHTGVEPREIELTEFVVRLLGVEPSPRSTASIDPDDYRAVLTVDARQTP